MRLSASGRLISMTARQLLILALAIVAIASFVAAKFLWAFTAWYEWIALAIGGACMLALKLLLTDRTEDDSQWLKGKDD